MKKLLAIAVVLTGAMTAQANIGETTIQTVRPPLSTAETQPTLNPALMILLTMISQYFIGQPRRK
jgi:hypothetical protein